MINDSGKHSPRNEDFRECSYSYQKTISKFTVFIETPQKFSQIGPSAQFAFYGLGGETEDPTMAVFPVFRAAVLSHQRNRLKSHDRDKILRQHPHQFTIIEVTK